MLWNIVTPKAKNPTSSSDLIIMIKDDKKLYIDKGKP